jgi:Flp pilus assembly protein TadD
MAQRQQRAARKRQVSKPAPVVQGTELRPSRALAVPLVFTVALFGLSFLPAIRQHPRLVWSFWGACIALLIWNGALLATAQQRKRTLIVQVELRKQHYLQACAQSAVLIYWGWYWREVYASAGLIVAQLAFAYAFDALLTWSRRDTYTLGFGPFPIIFSTNLFLWFKPDYFYLQFLMVAVGFAGKALIQWTKDGRRTHIFNPSSFTLAVFSVGLILTGTTHLTWGPDIARTQLLPPYIYLLIFLVALPGQFLFGVAAMTLAAVATTFTFNLVYFWMTGVYYFLEPSVPIAVFLSMHLLFTDPSTSPRTDLGRLAFGVMYGLGVVLVYALLIRAGVPPFYDKLLPVPILNLMIQGIDRAARSNLLKRFDPALWSGHRSPRWRYLAYVVVWAGIFTTMQLTTATPIALARADMQMSVGETDTAIATYRELLRGAPDHVVARNKLGFALLQAGRLEEALATLRQASAVQPGDANTQNNLGLVLVQLGRPAEAVPPLEQAVKLQPDYAEAHYNLAQADAASGRPAAAVAEFREALRVRPEWPAAMGALAWTEVTNGDSGAYDPADAVRLATRAAELTGGNDVAILDALAAAQAAAGRFSDAAQTAERAATLADTSAPNLAADIRARLTRYRAGQPLVSVNR